MYKTHLTSKTIFKFFILLSIIACYLFYISYKFGIQQGFLVVLLSWSFFVLCTPIADAGFLLDFPIRLFFNLHMIITEILVWIIAIALNLYCFFFNPEIYYKTKLLSLFYSILQKPFPLWIIIFISLIGTFLSISFGDELFNIMKLKNKSNILKSSHEKNKIIFMSTIIGISIVFYYCFLKYMNIKI